MSCFNEYITKTGHFCCYLYQHILTVTDKKRFELANTNPKRYNIHRALMFGDIGSPYKF